MTVHADLHTCECTTHNNMLIFLSCLHVVPACVLGAWLCMHVNVVSMADVCVSECCATTFLSITQPLHQEVSVGVQASFNQRKIPSPINLINPTAEKDKLNET